MSTKLLINKFENIQALRGIAVMLVVFFHLVVIEAKYGHGTLLLPAFFNVGAAGVDIFFVISGFIMATIIRNQFQDFNNIANFAFHRVTRIYPLYWFFSFLVLIVFLVHPEWVNQSEKHQINILRSFLLLPQAELPLLAVGWTLIYEIYFYCVIALMLFLPERWFLKCIFLWLLSISLIHYFFDPTSPILAVATNPLVSEFAMGCLIARALHSFKRFYNFIILGLGFVLLFGLFDVYQHLNFVAANEMANDWTRVLIFGVPSMFIVYGAVAMELKQLKFPAILVKLGDASYSIYLSHVLVLSALGRIWQKFPFDNLIWHMFALVALVVAVISFGLISHQYLEKPMISYFRNWIERRPVESELKT